MIYFTLSLTQAHRFTHRQINFVCVDTCVHVNFVFLQLSALDKTVSVQPYVYTLLNLWMSKRDNFEFIVSTRKITNVCIWAVLVQLWLPVNVFNLIYNDCSYSTNPSLYFINTGAIFKDSNLSLNLILPCT